MGDSTINGSLTVTKKLKTSHMTADDGSGNLTAVSGAFQSSLTVGGQAVLTSGGISGNVTLTGGLAAEGPAPVPSGVPSVGVGTTSGGVPYIQGQSASGTTTFTINPNGGAVQTGSTVAGSPMVLDDGLGRMTVNTVTAGSLTGTAVIESKGNVIGDTGFNTNGGPFALVFTNANPVVSITSASSLAMPAMNAGTNSLTAGSTTFGSITNSGTSNLTGSVSCGSVTSTGAVSGTSLSAGTSGSITGGALTAASVSSGTGAITGGAFTSSSLNNTGTSSLTGTVSCGAVTSTGVVSGTAFSSGTGSITGGAVTATSLNNTGTSSLTGTVSCGSVTSTGTVSGAALSSGTGSITGGAVTATSLSNTGTSSLTGTLSCGSLTSTGIVTGTGMSSGTGSIMGGALTVSSVSNTGTSSLTGSVSCGSVTSTGAVSGTSLSAGTSGAITGGALTASSISSGTGAMTGGTLTCSSLHSTGTSNLTGDVTYGGKLNSSGTGGIFLDTAGNVVFKSTSASSNGWFVNTTGGGFGLLVFNNTAAGGSQVKTFNNILDDGSVGNMTVLGSLTAASISAGAGSISGGAITGTTITNSGPITTSLSSTSGNLATASFLQPSIPTGQAIGIQVGVGAGVAGHIFDSTLISFQNVGGDNSHSNTATMSVFGGPGVVVDGNGLTTLPSAVVTGGLTAATVTSTGNLTVTNNTLKNSAGNSITLPSSVGTLALTSQVPVLNWTAFQLTNASTATVATITTFSNSAASTITVASNTVSAPVGKYAITISGAPTVAASTTANLQLQSSTGSASFMGLSAPNVVNTDAINSHVLSLCGTFVATVTSPLTFQIGVINIALNQLQFGVLYITQIG